MAKADYIGREQTAVKHYVLREYLRRFALIVGNKWSSITYVDCFTGPWNSRSETFDDSSFAIALRELRVARDSLKRSPLLGIRCFFIERDQPAYKKLRTFTDSITDAQVETKNSDLESVIPEICKFVHADTSTFPFFFIDPTGWTGFAMDVIRPLLVMRPSEVLINFMTGHIRRFIDAPNEVAHESFVQLFGNATFKDKLPGLTLQDREDCIVDAYCEAVRKTGGFEHVCSAIVLHPEYDRTHFHLIYATRNDKGVEVFKDTERRAMALMDRERAEAQQRRRVKQTGQLELFDSEVRYDPTLYDKLRTRYLSKARDAIDLRLARDGFILYDDAWLIAMRTPLVWESDLKAWIDESQRSGRLRIDGLAPRQRVPKRRQNHRLVWTQN